MSALESALLRAAGFRHGFSIRPWDFRNDRERSEEALSLLLRLPRQRTYRVSQVHGARVLRASGDVAALAHEEADALVASEPGVAVSVRVADCVPVLLADSNSGAVAAVHAGWRGVVLGVVAAAFELGGAYDLAAIGPCIGACCFAIGDDVAQKLAPHASGGHGDLRAAVRAQLRAHGVQDAHIEDVAGCTMCDSTRFFSFRREGEAAGRHLAVIGVRS